MPVCFTCGQPQTSTVPLYTLKGGAETIDGNTYCGKCSIPAGRKATMTYFERTRPDFEETLQYYQNKLKSSSTPPPAPPRPKALSREHLFNLTDPDHPKNFCFHCRKPLPPDYHRYWWNIVNAGDDYPMFDTQRCREAVTKRHYVAPISSKPVFLDDDLPTTRDRKIEQTREQNQFDEDEAHTAAYEAAAGEYRLAVQRYELERREVSVKLEPQQIPEHVRYEHTHILGPAGSGKTTLLQEMILDDLVKPDPPAMVIIDPKGLMVERIARLQVFADRLKDRLIIIDPTSQPLPALNMFRPPPDGVESLSISNFAYIFSQAGVSLTSKMGPPFMFAVRLMFTIDGANLFTLMDLFDDSPKERKFQPHIDRLTDYATKRFFNSDFYSANYNATREQIKSRLYEIIARPEIVEMFNAPTCAIDMFECLQQRKIVLVNTGMLKLGSTGSQLLGRYIISSTLNAAYRRSRIPKGLWNPAYLFIDEFQDFADEQKTPELLRLAREYNLGVVLAHQNMHCNELNDSLRTSISTNTSIKYSSTPEAIDQNYMARDLRCDAEFLKKHTAPGTFACFARGLNLQGPFLKRVQFGNIENQPLSSDDSYRSVFGAAKRAAASKSLSEPTRKKPETATKSAPKPQPSPQSDSGEPASEW